MKPSHAMRSRAASVAHILLWLWMAGLTALVLISFRVAGDLAAQEQLDTALRQLQLLEVGVEELNDAHQTLQARPQAVTAAALQSTRQALDARIGQLEQALAERSKVDELEALRREVEQLKASRTAARPASPAPARAIRPAAAATKEPTMPFRVVGLDLRAGQLTVSVAPASGEWSAAQIQVVLPGESVGQWRLDAIDGGTAVFSHAGQTRRLAIP
ncbi:Methyl-accepting chemotaxis protein [plant metagenome]|uniref:Methyl-accepting chemotaxis protein n=1 Tax=plant metagenome TaxID=1297885 RepID=A0A484TJ82_9ZZZZ